MLRLTFLGTGTSQGVPMIGCDCEVCRSDDMHDKRLRSSAMIEYFSNPHDDDPKNRIIIDSGPDFRFQMLRENVKWIDAILLTHEHKDHIAGLDDVRAFNYFQQKATPVYASERTAGIVEKDFDYAFEELKYPGAPEIDLRIINPELQFEAGGLTVTPINGLHYRLPVMGFRVGRLAYLTDFNSIPETEIKKLRGVEILVINALRHEKHISHYTVEEAIETGKLIGARETFFTHMSHQVGLYRDIKGILPERFNFAYDGLKIEIQK